MGDSQKGVLRVDFDRRVRSAFLDGKGTTDAGLLAHRETDEVLGLTEMADDSLCDSRGGSNEQHQLVALLRQSIYSRLAGDEDVNDAERLARIIHECRGGVWQVVVAHGGCSRSKPKGSRS